MVVSVGQPSVSTSSTYSTVQYSTVQCSTVSTSSTSALSAPSVATSSRTNMSYGVSVSRISNRMANGSPTCAIILLCDICNISGIVQTNLTHHSCCNVIPILICDPHSDVRRFEQSLFCIAPVKLQVYKVFMEVFYMTSKNEEVSTYDDKHSQTWHDDYFHSSYCCATIAGWHLFCSSSPSSMAWYTTLLLMLYTQLTCSPMSPLVTILSWCCRMISVPTSPGHLVFGDFNCLYKKISNITTDLYHC